MYNAINFAITWASAHLLFILWVAFLLAFLILYLSSLQKKFSKPQHKLSRSYKNPIISPLAHQHWENIGTFNPAVVEDHEGRIHMFYRAIGSDGVSRVGHAVSDDGIHFSERSPYPVFVPPRGYGGGHETFTNNPKKYDPTFYTSGGGWSGSEDPRAVRIDDKIYMTYTAFESWGSVRIAVTSIKLDDLKHKRWAWKRPSLLSSSDTVNKNWVLFPEKINDKFVILHGISPKIFINYVDNLDNFPKDKYIESLPQHHGHGYTEKSREDFWDNRMRGAGAPPIKTRLGWLLLYHAIDDNKYKVGAMILDLHNPTKVLYRSPEPILSPEVHYENDWKPGVVYASGAIVKNEKLLVYYGGGDKYVGVAETPLEELLVWLKTYGKQL